MKTITKILGAAFFLSLAIGASAQNGWNWGEQVDIAKEKNVLYTDAYKAKNYQAAIPPLNWLLTNTPNLNPSIYINGIKIYQALAKKETDAAKKEEYIQKGLELHDTRIQYYPEDEADILDRKSIYAYGFYSKKKEKYPYLYELYSKAFELNGANMNSGNLVAYMNVVYKHKFAGGDLSDEQVIEIYSAIADALEEQKSRVSGDNKKKYDKMIDNVDKILTATGVEISCSFVEEKLGPKLDQGEDLNMAKKIFGLMLKGKCLDSPLALKAAGIVQNSEPTYGVAKFMAQKNAQDGDDAKAIEYFQEAADLTDDNSEKAEMYVNIARIQMKNGQKSTARNSARRALSFDPSHKDAYKLIGDLYMTSFDDCKGEKSQVQDRAVFIAAYNEYKKAGNSQAMAAAKAQFPSIEDIFNENMEEGQSITIGCWINVTVALERRPAN
ncbi:tetratricopeptide repeat protein [Ekhidna sp.]|uniref:tetratricopeptide repeat protein n=1 Tax=Ekhidna sp. TaxID=2608089 RepID=UPI003B51154A